MKLKIITITFIAVLFLIIFSLIGYAMHLQNTMDYFLDHAKERQEDSIELTKEFTDNYNELYGQYTELYRDYVKLAKTSRLLEDWEKYEVSAYTSLDEGCNSISSTGINIEKLSKLYNFAAVDPDVIPYGSIILVNFDTGIEPFLSVDCGEAIKGKHIDLYFVNDLKNAFKFGKKEMEIKVIE